MNQVTSPKNDKMPLVRQKTMIEPPETISRAITNPINDFERLMSPKNSVMSPKQQKLVNRQQTATKEHQFALPDISGPMSPGRVVPIQNEKLVEEVKVQKLKSSLTTGHTPIKAREDLIDSNLTGLKMERNELTFTRTLASTRAIMQFEQLQKEKTLKREKNISKAQVDVLDGQIQTEDNSAIVEAILIKDNLFEKIKCFIFEMIQEERQRNAIEIKK